MRAIARSVSSVVRPAAPDGPNPLGRRRLSRAVPCTALLCVFVTLALLLVAALVYFVVQTRYSAFGPARRPGTRAWLMEPSSQGRAPPWRPPPPRVRPTGLHRSRSRTSTRTRPTPWDSPASTTSLAASASLLRSMVSSPAPDTHSTSTRFAAPPCSARGGSTSRLHPPLPSSRARKPGTWARFWTRRAATTTAAPASLTTARQGIWAMCSPPASG